MSQIFNHFSINNINSQVDNFSNYQVDFTITCDEHSLAALSSENYNILNKAIQEHHYNWTLEIEDINYTINQSQFIEIEPDELEDLDILSVKLQIFKQGKIVVIYDEQSFINTLNSLTIEGVLVLLNQDYHEGIILINQNSQEKLSNSYIGYNENSEEKIIEASISSQCQFANYSIIKLAPDNFDLASYHSNDSIIQYLNKIYKVLILIYIFDKSELKQNYISLKIQGLKTLDYNLDFTTLSTGSLNTYAKIYNWIQSEKSKVEDKIGIARNILSLYLKDSNIEIDDNAYTSILSANNTYIKSNISKYVEVRNKLHDQIEQISAKVNSSLEVFYNNFQKSIFVFISFYLTIFVLKIYGKTEVTSVITKEATIMALGLLGLSIAFLFFSNWVLNSEKIRLVDKYSNIKKRGLDLLLQDDIDKILDNDREFDEELSFLERKRTIYILLWCSMLIIFCLILFTTSDYINFKYIRKTDIHNLLRYLFPYY